MARGPEFADDHIRLPADAWLPRTTLTAADVRDADPEASPPELRTRSGETVFVPAGLRAELERFCARNGIPLRRRQDVWGDLLDPFLDTWFTPEEEAATLARLDRAGLAPAEVAAIRERVAPLMRAHNHMLWEWHALGLGDLLAAAAGSLVPDHLRIPPQERAAFRAWAMEIADRPARRTVRGDGRAAGTGGRRPRAR
ncbi:hypothetical protein ACFXJO_11675 [Streptomyces lavendulae]|uniref:hypothetical protein n=1 Tax=Streptomyces lavendulae TaxID=1914 RepID=UPI00367A23D1